MGGGSSLTPFEVELFFEFLKFKRIGTQWRPISPAVQYELLFSRLCMGVSGRGKPYQCCGSPGEKHPLSVPNMVPTTRLMAAKIDAQAGWKYLRGFLYGAT